MQFSLDEPRPPPSQLSLKQLRRIRAGLDNPMAAIRKVRQDAHSRAEVLRGVKTARWASWVGAVLSHIEDNHASFRNEGGGRWASPGDPIAEDDRLWRQYLVLVDLCKFYLATALKAAVWYIATTGAILTYSSAI
jgi:hypothetical protein